MTEAELARARAAAQAFVRAEAGFAQVTTIDREGYPVTRTMVAFLEEDWSVSLVQRRLHKRVGQWTRNPRTLVTWVGDPAPGATNEHPHVFDVGLLPPRLVAVRGDARFQDAAWTRRLYRLHLEEQRARGHTKAPVRTDAQVAEELLGVRVLPRRVRLEGFGVEAQSFDWAIAPEEG